MFALTVRTHGNDEKGEDDEKDYSEFKTASLNDLTLSELKDLAKEKGIKGYSKMAKEELLNELDK